MSAEFLVNGLFKGSRREHVVAVPFHTGDMQIDNIYPNENVRTTRHSVADTLEPSEVDGKVELPDGL
jgi:hypothetical protein